MPILKRKKATKKTTKRATKKKVAKRATKKKVARRRGFLQNDPVEVYEDETRRDVMRQINVIDTLNEIASDGEDAIKNITTALRGGPYKRNPLAQDRMVFLLNEDVEFREGIRKKTRKLRECSDELFNYIDETVERIREDDILLERGPRRFANMRRRK